MDLWSGTSLLWDHLHQYPEVFVLSDASGSWGCGAMVESSWLQHEWLPGASTMSIAHKELISIVMAALVWGHQWSGKVVQFRSDNEAGGGTKQTISER